MRAHEFEAPVSLQQAQEKNLKQQEKHIQIQLKQKRLQKQRSKVADTAQQHALQVEVSADTRFYDNIFDGAKRSVNIFSHDIIIKGGVIRWTGGDDVRGVKFQGHLLIIRTRDALGKVRLPAIDCIAIAHLPSDMGSAGFGAQHLFRLVHPGA
jgi:hypothetical protein